MRRPNPHYDKIIKEIVDELDITEVRVRLALRHFFEWQRVAFKEGKAACFLWPGFGTFTYFNRSDGRGDYFEEANEYRRLKGKRLINTKPNGIQQTAEQDEVTQEVGSSPQRQAQNG